MFGRVPKNAAPLAGTRAQDRQSMLEMTKKSTGDMFDDDDDMDGTDNEFTELDDTTSRTLGADGAEGDGGEGHERGKDHDPEQEKMWNNQVWHAAQHAASDFTTVSDIVFDIFGPSFAYSLPVHSFHTRRDRVASSTTCRLHGAAIQIASPLGPGRALTLPCGWNNAAGTGR